VNAHPSQDDCAWCALPKAKRGIVAGVAASLAVHLALAGAVFYLGQAPSELKPVRQIPVIDMGSITIHRLHQLGSSPQSQEL
jgi:hypothetical protein